MEKDQIVSLEIHGLGSGGEGVGEVDGYVLFVDGALPGELIEAKIREKRKRHGFAELVSTLRPSPDRKVPPCPLFGRCGGCQLMHLDYPAQLEVKRQKVVDALQRIGKIDCRVEACAPSPKTLAYRNKIQLPVRQGLFGLYAKNSHDLVEVSECSIHCQLGEEVFQAVKKLLKTAPLRHLIIKTAMQTNEVLVTLVTDEIPPLFRLGEKILKAHRCIKGVVQNFHRGRENVILGKEFKTLAGSDFIEERLSDLKFRITAASFFQVNPLAAEKLYAKALEYAELKGDETVLDAYCGVGTLSLFFARHLKEVFGVESIPQAVENARENAKLNQIDNVSFTLATSEDFIKKAPPVDLILINPPRKGCERSFLDGVGALAPKRAIYISCDPATLARDLAHLESFGYKVDAVQPFDMFPQTSHVECVAKLSLSTGQTVEKNV